MLTFLPERLRLLAKTGVDAILVLPFDEALSRVTAEDFVRNVLVGLLKVRGIHEGGNFRFGHGAKAGITELRAFGEEFGFAVHVHAPVRVHGLEVSSSAVRRMVAEGEVGPARWMLGRVFGVHAHPAKGRGVGTKLLVPTVNLAPYDGLLPGFGVYVTRLIINDQCFEAVTNVGNRPTFEGVGFGVETHILNFTPVDLTDETPLPPRFPASPPRRDAVAVNRGPQGPDIQGRRPREALFPNRVAPSRQSVTPIAIHAGLQFTHAVSLKCGCAACVALSRFVRSCARPRSTPAT